MHKKLYITYKTSEHKVYTTVIFVYKINTKISSTTLIYLCLALRVIPIIFQHGSVKAKTLTESEFF